MRRTVFNVYAVVAFTFALLFATGCAVFRAYWEWSSYYAYVSENRVFPKKPRFKVLPKHIDALSPLRTDGVYYMWMHWPPDTPNPDCQYMRFWPDGRVLGWFVTARFPTTWDAESFNRVRMGFHHSEGTNICIELYLPDLYSSMSGVIYDGSITINSVTNRTDSGYTTFSDECADTLTFLPLQGMKRQPDWSPTGMLRQCSSPIGTGKE